MEIVAFGDFMYEHRNILHLMFALARRMSYMFITEFIDSAPQFSDTSHALVYTVLVWGGGLYVHS